MKRMLFIMLFLSNIVASYAQDLETDTVGAAFGVSVIDSSLIDVLDYIENELNQCVFYNLQFSYYYLCYFKEENVRIMAIPYDKNTAYFLRNIKSTVRTFFYHKENLIVALDMNSRFFNKTFTLSDSLTLSFQCVNKNKPSIELGFDCCWVNCVYDINGHVKIDDYHACSYRNYHYVVEDGDCWETIALKIGTTKEIIQSMLGTYFIESPKNGDILEITYEIDQNMLKITALKLKCFMSNQN